MAEHHDLPVTQRTRQILNAVAAVLAVITLLGLLVWRPGNREDRPNVEQAGAPSSFYDAEVSDIRSDACQGTPAESGIRCDLVSLRLLEGPDTGQRVDVDFPESQTTPDVSPGDKLVLSYTPTAPPGFQYQFADRQRKPVLFWLAALFALAVVVLGRLRGFSALAGLSASLVVLLAFSVPAIIDGRTPIGVAVVSAAAISFFALYLAHGFRAMTTVALLGTLASLGLTAVLGVVFMELADFSGFASEEATFLAAAAGSIDLRGLLLAGVVIGALGAIDDMTVTQASAIAELHAANPDMGRRRLYLAGLRIGRDHVASTVNTLVLAYAAASMPLLVLFVLSRQSLASVANGEVVAIEIVRTLVGSIGLVASVPITTWLAAACISPEQRGSSDVEHEVN
ncbi:MAG TPA: YibE/F family protein [Acidimicrobiales bacterium]|nr:YibE/F family protein [Acidimicrobiales bacterium]